MKKALKKNCPWLLCILGLIALSEMILSRRIFLEIKDSETTSLSLLIVAYALGVTLRAKIFRKKERNRYLFRALKLVAAFSLSQASVFIFIQEIKFKVILSITTFMLLLLADYLLTNFIRKKAVNKSIK